MPTEILLPYLALLGTTIIWAVAGPIIKLGLGSIPPFTFLLYRFGLVAIVLLPYLYFELRDHPIDKRDIPNIFLLGVLGQTSIALIFLGLKYTTAIDSAIISSLSPVLVVWAGYYFFDEKITKLEKIGLMTATFGTFVVVLEPAIASLNGTNHVGTRIMGNLLVVAYNLMWPLYIVLGKRMMGQKSENINKVFHYFHLEKLHHKYSPMVLTAISFYIGLITIVPFALWEYFYLHETVIFDFPAVFGIVYMALLSSIAAYMLFQWGIKRVEASESALFTYISPLFAIPAAKVILGEIPSTTALYGLLLIAIGVFIAEKFKR